jgi:hypothetical protein
MPNESLKLTQKGGRKKWGGLTRSSVAPAFLGSLAWSLDEASQKLCANLGAKKIP